MRKLMALLLLLLTPCMALADFDNAALRGTENCIIMTQPGTWDTLICPINQPFQGEIEDGLLKVSVDYVEKANLGMTLIRLAVQIEVFDNVYADTIAITVGGKTYAFSVDAEIYEYDGIYQEDHYICLTDASLPFLKAVAQQKKDDPIPVVFIRGGETVLEGRVVIPGDDAAQIYDRFINLGGKSQDLKSIDEIWPCTITKVK
ncbi:MAG: hypothetical protein IJ343_07760 [Clostridia bacterium]|nr:hypothetical protein [Clostridia bacterium]